MGMMRKSRIPVGPFQSGQLWQVGEANVLIGQVGKTLVQYKLYKAKNPRVSTSLSAKRELEQYLRKNKAILVQE
jgi:hypothetical protein